MKGKFTTLEITNVVAWLILLLTSPVVNAQTIKLTPTFESIGIDWPRTDIEPESWCSVAFRPVGDTTWHQGLDLFTDEAIDYNTDDPNSASATEGFRGSIVLLTPGTKYEIKLTYSISGSESDQKTITPPPVETWSEAFEIEEEISITSREHLQQALRALKERTNRPTGKYVVFNGNGTTTIDGKAERNAIKLENFSYVILRNIKFTGGMRSAVEIVDSDHIVVEDCEIYRWGEDASFCGSANRGFKKGGKIAGVLVDGSSQVVVQHNTIHDPISNSCHWKSIPKEEGSSHPNGPRGIALVYGVTHSVFRYNQVYASFEDRKNHYFSDIFNGETEGTESDIDIYGNEFGNAWDDGVEIEGDNKNIRVWNNVIHNVFQGVASDRDGGKGASIYYGPVYFWRNIITDLHESPDDTEGQRAGFKLDNIRGQGGIYLFNNTLSGLGDDNKTPYQGITNMHQANMVMRNNIFEVRDKMFRNGRVQQSSDLNYNAYSDLNPENNLIEKEYWKAHWEANGQFGVKFNYPQPAEGWNFYARDNGAFKAQDAGIMIPNFIEQYADESPDLGAAEEGAWSMCVGPHADRNCPNGVLNEDTPDTNVLTANELALKNDRQLIVYPNPSPQGSARLQLSGFGETQLQIIDLKGHVVYRGLHRPNTTLPLRFPSGLYIVRVSDAQGTLTQKLMVE